MKRSIVKKLAIIAAAAFLAAGLACPALAKDKPKVVIGFLAHMTGAYAATQAGCMEGHMETIAYLNKANAVPGVELMGIWVDGGTDVAKSMAGFKKMMAHKPKPVVIHSESTPIGLVLKKWYIKAKTPTMEAGSDDRLFQLPSWTFSPACPNPNMCGAWVDYYLKNIWKDKSRKPKFAWLTWDNSFGRASITPKVKAYIKSKGVEIVGEEFVPMVPTDVSAQILRLKEKGVDFTYGGWYAEPLSVVIKEVAKQGLADKLTIGGAYCSTPENLIKYVGDLAGIAYAVSPAYSPSYALKHCPELVKIYNIKKREKNVFYMFAQGYMFASMGVEAVKIAAREVGPDKVDGPAVYKALQKIKGFTGKGMYAPVSFGPKKRFGQDKVFLMSHKNKQVQMLGLISAPDLTDIPK